MQFRILILLLLPTTLFAQSNRGMLHSMNVNVVTTPPLAKDTIRINFSTTAQTVATFNSFYGNPHASIISNFALKDINGTTTSVGLSTVATGNWSAYSGVTSNDPACCGITGMTFFGSSADNTTVAGSNFFNYGSSGVARYDAGKPQFTISGLKPASTYEIKVTGLDGIYGFDCYNLFRVVGLTSPSAIAVNGNVTTQPNGATFTIQPDVTGVINIWCNTNNSPSGDLMMVPALFITEQ